MMTAEDGQGRERRVRNEDGEMRALKEREDSHLGEKEQRVQKEGGEHHHEMPVVENPPGADHSQDRLEEL